MAWPVLIAAGAATVPLLRASWPEAPCEATAIQVARQQLPGDAGGAPTVDVSADGRFVAFVSMRRLDTADTNSLDDVYTLDRATGRVALESVTPRGGAADGSSQQPRLSADGRIVVFNSMAGNLTGGVAAGSRAQVVRRDRTTGRTVLVSRAVGGGPGNGWSGHADVSADGRHVVFESQATDLVAGPDANHGGSDVYLYDAVDGSLQRISLTDTGEQSASGQSWTPVVDAAGRAVAFTSTAPIDAPARARKDDPVRSVFVRDLVTGRTRRLSATRRGGVPDGASFQPAISGDGRRTVFVSLAGDLAGVERRVARPQLYLFDAETDRLRLASRTAAGAAADGAIRHPALSADGRFVVFTTDASDLPCPDGCGPLADVNLVTDVYRVDLATGTAARVSGGTGSRAAWWTASGGAAVDAAGHVIAFSSRQPVDEADLEPDDDLFVAVLGGTAADALAPSRPLPCGTPPARRGPAYVP